MNSIKTFKFFSHFRENNNFFFFLELYTGKTIFYQFYNNESM